MLKHFLLAICIGLTGCGARADSPAEPRPALAAAGPETATIRGARIEPSGYLTILSAPSAAYTPALPGEPQPLTRQQRSGHAQFARAGRFQNEVMDQVQALHRTLEAREKGNFVDLYFENEGEPHLVFRFLRDPEKTLARYTKDPRFKAMKADYGNAQLRAALDFMMETFREDRVIEGGGIGNKQNRAVITINVPDEEFRALVARKGVTIPDAVVLEFPQTTSAAQANRPLPVHIARFIRIFPRSDRPLGIVNAINSTAKVVLQDGCFRSPDQGNALVLFPMGANLFIDSEGYLAFGSGERPGYARVGETMIFPGSIYEVTAPELVRPIQAACGPGKVININGLQSAAAERAQSNVDANANALRQLRESYGLSEQAAQVALERCKAQMGMGVCMLTPPRPRRSEECPPGTRLSGGLCRTPEGYTRPVPEWIKDLVTN
jgi:hypothetical protein